MKAPSAPLSLAWVDTVTHFRYPVTNARYAAQIARDWTVKDSGAGFVTRFSRRCCRRIDLGFSVNRLYIAFA